MVFDELARSFRYLSAMEANTKRLKAETENEDKDMAPVRLAIPEEPTLYSIIEAILMMKTELREN